MRVAVAGVCTLFLTLSASCIPTPKKIGVRGKIADSALEFIQAGKTRRDEVLLHLGLPDQANQQESVFIYNWTTAWDVHTGYGVGELREDFILRIEFDDQGAVTRFEKKEKKKEEQGDDSDLDAYIRETFYPCYSSAACQLAGSVSDSNYYTNEEAGFSIQFPRKWTVSCGQDPVTVEASRGVHEGILPIFPTYWLAVGVQVHPIVAAADTSNLDRSSFLRKGHCCPETWACNWEISVIESEETVLDGVRCLREIYQVEEVNQVRHAYQLYRLGPKRFGNHATASYESHCYHQLLTYWFVQNDMVFQVTGDVSRFPLFSLGCPGAEDSAKEGSEKIKRAFEKHKKTLEEIIRSFRLNN